MPIEKPIPIERPSITKPEEKADQKSKRKTPLKYRIKILTARNNQEANPREVQKRQTRSLGDAIHPRLFLRNWLLEIPSMIMERRKLKKDPIFRGEGIPKFDNQPIVIIPGLIGIKPGRRAFSEWLQRIGCVPFMAEIGPKELTSESILGKIDKAVDKAYEATGKKPVLVGYSVGSMEAVYYANRHKDKIEKIITLGGPKTDSFEVHFLLDGLLQVVAGLGTGRKAMADFIHEAIMPPKVPTFSIYSKDDGIVNWKKCLIPNGDNREIHGGHLSMLGNAEVYRNIVEILGKS